MKRNLLFTGFALLAVASAGCAMCAHPFDYTYAAFGGSKQRANPYSGRVGSAFHPAEGVFASGEIPEGSVLREDGGQEPATGESVPTPDQPQGEPESDDAAFVPSVSNFAELNAPAAEPDLIFVE